MRTCLRFVGRDVSSESRGEDGNNLLAEETTNKGNKGGMIPVLARLKESSRKPSRDLIAFFILFLGFANLR